MKNWIATFLVFFSINASAGLQVNPDQMTEDQKIQLLQVLDQLDQEMLEVLLSDEALDWYIDQYTRGSEEVEARDIPVGTGQVDGIGGFGDPNAPKFL